VPAREVERFVRAADYAPFSSPWGTPHARLRGRQVGITKASLTGDVTDQPPDSVGAVLENGAVLVATADEWLAVRRQEVQGSDLKNLRKSSK
jgi:methionyl-tRNA formyltransferase